MIAIDTSVCVKWFKVGERYDAEAQNLRQRLERLEVEAAANEILSLEIVRALKNAQVRQPVLGITDADVETAFEVVERMFRAGILLECPVADVKTRARDAELSLGLFMADALHLATALHLSVDYFVVDDRHFLAPEVVSYSASEGVRVVDLPSLIAALTSDTGGPGVSAT